MSTSQTPAGAMVASPAVRFPDAAGLLAAIGRVTRKDENVALDAQALARLSADTDERAVALARLPDVIRGHENVKLPGVRRFREEVRGAQDG